MLTFIAKPTVKAGMEAEFERIMRAAAPKVRQEPGNRAYIFHRSKDNPQVFMFYEEYTDEAALDAHRKHLKEMGINLLSMLEGPPAVEKYEKLA